MELIQKYDILFPKFYFFNNDIVHCYDRGVTKSKIKFS